MEITCDKDHIYRVDGIVKPGVSEILSGLGLIDFRGVPTHDLEDGRERGTEVHAITESFDLGKLKIESVDERLIGYTKSWLLFCKEYSPKWSAIEKTFYSKTWGYCGKPDRVGIISKNNTLVDIKTSLMKSPAYEIQTALYKIGHEEGTGTKIKNRWVVQLSRDGEMPKIVKHEKTTDISVAMAAVTIFKWKVLNKQDADIKYSKELFGFQGGYKI